MQNILKYHTVEKSEIKTSYTLLVRVKIGFAIF